MSGFEDSARPTPGRYTRPKGALAGYFRREEVLADSLERFNDAFPEAQAVTAQLDVAFGSVDACPSPPSAGSGKKLTSSPCFRIRSGKLPLDPQAAGTRRAAFSAAVDELSSADPAGESDVARSVSGNVLRYMKAATKATNDKYARVDRAEVIFPLLVGVPSPKPTPPKGKRK